MQIEIADKTTREEYTLDWSQSKVFLVYMHTGTTVVYVQQSEESRHQSYTGRGYSQCRK